MVPERHSSFLDAKTLNFLLHKENKPQRSLSGRQSRLPREAFLEAHAPPSPAAPVQGCGAQGSARRGSDHATVPAAQMLAETPAEELGPR